ncbi:MAG: adenosylcobinamide-GDP ribazoletransferase [Oscillospiraceae bacterium]
MTFFKSIAIAFSMFSKIPMPHLEWDKKSMRYMMCMFPLVGVVSGAAFFGWGMLSDILEIGAPLRAALLLLIPVAITGGIHLDGFCDTIDALSSHADRARKLEILKDSHAGAFAVIGVCTYLILYFALLCELKPDVKSLLALSVGFVLSRSLSGLAVASFPCAKDSGLVHTFADMSARKIARAILFAELLVCCAVLCVFCGAAGAAAVLAAALSFLWYWHMSQKQFGGITGDIAGWFVQICELMIAAFVVAVQFLI